MSLRVIHPTMLCKKKRFSIDHHNLYIYTLIIITMDIRKLVKSGHSSLVAALPRSWILRNKLKQGDLIYISQDQDKIIIETEIKREAPKKKEIIITTEN